MSIDITEVFSAIITLFSALLTTLLLPWLKNKLGAQRFSTAMEWVKIGAAAAEQVYSGPGRGEEKKAYVLSLLERAGVSLDSEALDAVIEAEVHRLQSEVRQ